MWPICFSQLKQFSKPLRLIATILDKHFGVIEIKGIFEELQKLSFFCFKWNVKRQWKFYFLQLSCFWIFSSLFGIVYVNIPCFVMCVNKSCEKSSKIVLYFLSFIQYSLVDVKLHSDQAIIRGNGTAFLGTTRVVFKGLDCVILKNSNRVSFSDHRDPISFLWARREESSLISISLTFNHTLDFEGVHCHFCENESQIMLLKTYHFLGQFFFTINYKLWPLNHILHRFLGTNYVNRFARIKL